FVTREMDGEIAPGCERVAVIVSRGGEPEALVMVDRSFQVANAEDGIETGERLQSVENRDLTGSLAVQVVETGGTDHDVGTGPQCHPTLIERFAAARTYRGRHPRAALSARSAQLIFTRSYCPIRDLAASADRRIWPRRVSAASKRQGAARCRCFMWTC